MKSLGRFHPPGNQKSKSGQAETDEDQHSHERDKLEKSKGEPDQRSKRKKNNCLNYRERHSAKNFSEHNARAGNRRDKDRLEESFISVFDDRDRGENRSKEHDQQQGPRVEIFQIIRSAERGCCLKRRAKA